MSHHNGREMAARRQKAGLPVHRWLTSEPRNGCWWHLLCSRAGAGEEVRLAAAAAQSRDDKPGVRPSGLPA